MTQRRLFVNLKIAFLTVLMVFTGGAVVASGATSGALASSLPVASKSKLVVTALPYQTATTVTAEFKGDDVRKGRVVSLQRKLGAKWKVVKDAKMNAKGTVTFKLSGANSSAYKTYTYRAVADKITYKVKNKKKTLKIVTTKTVTPTQWKRVFKDDFNGKALDDTKWTHRPSGFNDLTGLRQCAKTEASNIKVSNGALRLTMTKAPAAMAKERSAAVAKLKRDAAIEAAEKKIASAKKAVDAAKKKSKAAQKAADTRHKAAKKELAAAKKLTKTNGCPDGVFLNGMVATDDRFSVKSGLMVAKVKFPKGQGVHGAAWLQDRVSGQEIDVIESYGYGKGVASVVHVLSGSKLTKKPAKAADGYVVKSATKNAAWWNRYHTFSAEFNPQQVVFRVDGEVTRTVKAKFAKVEYSALLSMLSSDWELPALKQPTQGAKGVKKASLPLTMYVDSVQIFEKA
jgi:beta-glucanase (GH16 family)